MKPQEEQCFEYPDQYRILMDGRWELDDLYTIPHTFEQCYSFIYCFDASVRPINSNRIDFALHKYPWRGGYSYINIYSVLRNQIEWRDRPRIRAIKYSSPGWIDLALNLDVAVQVAKAVGLLAGSAVAATKSYAAIAKILSAINTEREKAKLVRLKLTTEKSAQLIKLCEAHAKFLGFKSVKALNDHTGSPEVTLRLLLAHHRRLEQIGEYIEEGKVNLPTKSRKKR